MSVNKPGSAFDPSVAIGPATERQAFGGLTRFQFQIDPNVIDTALEPLPRQQAPRVLSQTVPANTFVPPGTTIDIVVAPSSSIPASVFVGGHPSFQHFNLAEISALYLSIPAVGTAVAQGTPLSEAQKVEVTAALRAKNIIVDETDPAQNLDRALETLNTARLFSE